MSVNYVQANNAFFWKTVRVKCYPLDYTHFNFFAFIYIEICWEIELISITCYNAASFFFKLIKLLKIALLTLFRQN